MALIGHARADVDVLVGNVFGSDLLRLCTHAQPLDLAQRFVEPLRRNSQ